MKTRLISPQELDPGAVVPQCLDVHYVSDAVMHTMMHENRDYHDPVIVARREQDTFLEYRRSLLFARQTVINRAFFTNPLVYADFEERYGNEGSRYAFKQLVDDGTIVPYLFKDSEFLTDLEKLKTSPAAKDALASLSDLIDELRCVRLAVGDEANSEACDRLDQSFRGFAVALGEVRRSALLNSLASELYRGQPMEHHELEGLGKALLEISKFALNADQLNRTVLYEQFLTNGDHHHGRFKKPSENPFMLAQKKALDLRYNTGLPDLLQRFALTPRGLPTHAAVDYVLPTGQRRTTDGDAFLAKVTDRSLLRHMDVLHEAYHLPHLSQLTIADVAHLRSLPEWHAFADAQGRLLENAHDPAAHLAEASRALGAFQRAFSRWYYRTHPEAAPVKRYRAAVTVCLQILGVTLAVLSTDAGMLERIVIGSFPASIPERVKGLVARQLVDFYDPDTRQIDRSYSYSLDLLRSGTELSKGDVMDLFQQFGMMPSEEANAGAPE